MVPSELRYTKDHEWVRIDQQIATVGITPYAQEALGDVVFVELPAVGRTFTAGDVAGVVESVKAASDIFMPVAGVIAEVNAALSQNSSLVNSDPLGAGWLFKITLANPSDLDQLLDEAAYAALTAT